MSFKPYNKAYNLEVLQHIYKKLLEAIAYRDQWKELHTVDWAANVHTYHAQAEALLSLLESATVFHVGGGYYKDFCKGFDSRVASFDFLAKK
ncbi:MAG: hypothetical protein ACK5PF_02915 [bacterium]